MELKYVKIKDDHLAHYGVKGMKWGHHNASVSKEFLEEKAYNSKKNSFVNGGKTFEEGRKEEQDRYEERSKAMLDAYNKRVDEMNREYNESVKDLLQFGPHKRLLKSAMTIIGNFYVKKIKKIFPFLK